MLSALKSLVGRCGWMYLVAFLLYAFLTDASLAARQREQYLALVFAHKGKNLEYNDGVVYYDFLTRHKPNAEAWANLGYCYYGLKDFKRAAQAYQHAATLDPASAFFQEMFLKSSQRATSQTP